MLDVSETPLYIGKAGNLRHRLSSYFRGQLPPRQEAMLAKVARIEVTVTRTEGEALLLESQLIKRYRPRYNVSLKDDKSYPYIYVATEQDFPRVSFHRGAQSLPGRYFGPYPSASAVRQTLKILKKAFPVRQCEDSYFHHRNRPCLEYQIKRCSAPCVGWVTAAEYRQDVEDTLRFLEGDGQKLMEDLVLRMESAAGRLEFEKAARYRDQIAALREILETNALKDGQGDLDAIAVAKEGGIACVQIAWFRGGRYLGDKAYFPSCPEEATPAQVLAAFLGQYYLNKPIPSEILLSHPVEERDLLREVLEKQAGRSVSLITHPRGQRQKWLEMTRANAKAMLDQRLAKLRGLSWQAQALAELLGLSSPLNRIEGFDVSHLQGKQTVASCVVFEQARPLKSAYRRFNISAIVPGDDYAAMAQAIRRRFKHADNLPDLVLIDGGKGQAQAAGAVLAELGLATLPLVGVTKGPERRGGEEDLYLAWKEAWLHPGDHPGLLLIRQIRDEAHRFALEGHRRRLRGRRSVLESIQGIGTQRRKLLLQQFGGLSGLKKASVEALSSVKGIGRQLAQRIYETLHGQSA
jgi:excinuclease ABC subunit C